MSLAPTVELGHLAYARGLCPTKAPSLHSIVQRLWPGVELEGKEGGSGPRCSDWRASSLTADQIEYCANDGYTTAVSYNRIMQFMDPRVEGRILAKDVVNGLEVTLYSKGWKGRVATGVICGYSKKKIQVEIDLAKHANIYAPGTLVDVVQPGNDGVYSTIRESLAVCCERYANADNNEANSLLKVE